MQFERVKELLRQGKAAQIGIEGKAMSQKDLHKMIDLAADQVKKEKKK